MSTLTDEQDSALIKHIDAHIAAAMADVEQLKAALYEVTKITVTEGGEGEICSFCGAISNDDGDDVDEDGNTLYRELDDPDGHKETCAWRRGVELSIDVHRKKNAERYGTKDRGEPDVK